MKLDSNKMRLYAVTDRMWLDGRSLAFCVEEAVKAGATFVQLREKELSFDDFLHQAIEIKRVTDKYNIPFVINDDIEVALACNADGVHVGQGDMTAREARVRMGEGKILGVSVQTEEQAIKAEREGADYIGVGAVFSTSTKHDADEVSFEILKAICKAVSIPVVAIGGISIENIMQLSGSGVDGVAVISAIFAQKDIFAAAKELRHLSDKMVKSTLSD